MLSLKLQNSSLKDVDRSWQQSTSKLECHLHVLQGVSAKFVDIAADSAVMVHLQHTVTVNAHTAWVQMQQLVGNLKSTSQK